MQIINNFQVVPKKSFKIHFPPSTSTIKICERFEKCNCDRKYETYFIFKKHEKYLHQQLTTAFVYCAHAGGTISKFLRQTII